MSKQISKHINKLLLDPNNYRFIDNKDYIQIPEDQIFEKRIQDRTFNFLVGRNLENISDLIISFKTNGVLKLDPIQVKEIGDHFLVIEGNRRTAALKYLYEQWKNNNDVGVLQEKDFKSIEVIQISDENPIQHLITMGLHHINGKRKWSPVNQAQLINDLKYKYNLTEEEICNSLAITKHNLKRNLRVHSLINRYKDSDYGDQFETNMYSIFEEIIKNVNIKNWLDWDDSNMQPFNSLNEEKIFSWISTIEEIDLESDDEITIIKEPIITKSHEIRDLSKFINDPKALEKMEEARSISEGFALSEAVGESRLKNALDNILKEVNTAFQFSEYLDQDELNKAHKIQKKFEKLFSSESNSVVIGSKNSKYYYEHIDKHFSDINVKEYRKLKNIEIKKLKKVNIFAGFNNNGKTSVLEAIYLITKLNNLQSLIDLEKFRGKFTNDFPTKWFDKIFVKNIDINSTFNNENIALHISKVSTDENFDKSHYISSIKTEISINEFTTESSINLFDNKDVEFYYSDLFLLCPSAFTSPFRYNSDLIKQAHAKAVYNKNLELILDFINQHFDISIEKIDMIEIEGISRFLVTSNNLDHAIDLTKFGEGLQRIFEIALLICYCKNGTLFIDELDSAIHKKLLVPFTEFIQKLSDTFNVQIFLTSHSKECIDAFVENEYPDDNLMAYTLKENEGNLICQFVEGNKLKNLVESINFDIR